MSTEKKLWAAIKPQVPEGSRFTRIETMTEAGVSDIEYVHAGWHGWIELKTSSSTTDRRLVLHHPYSLAQLGWLLTHHKPASRLRSWLLVGFFGRRTWSKFVLLPPRESALLVHVNRAPMYRDVIMHPNVVVLESVKEVLAHIAKG